MQTTNISWCDYSWNPVTGCSRAGPICAHEVETEDGTKIVSKCYAETMSRKQAKRDNPPAFASTEPWTLENASENVTMHPDRLAAPDHYRYPDGPGTVFVGSMTDMFHSEVDPGFVQRVLDKCREHPRHLWIWLTKRPQHAADWRLDWPPNTMLGVSVGSAGRDYPATTHRIEQLRDVDAPLKWVSFEPLLEPMPELALDHIDWMVVGGESAPKKHRREMDDDWARGLYQQARRKDVNYFYKQGSHRYPDRDTELEVYNPTHDVREVGEIREPPTIPQVVTDARRNTEEATA